jgi:diaminohydroxyphosphoribosylaminopyrimidine deaminase/5-amino-6-(5-phosphoribosylamino)uracil reductase
MQRALKLAQYGKLHVYPNPMVGCVIVHQNKIIGEGYHTKYGQPHAEVNAIHSVKNKKLLKESTLYVTLEPCFHHGKTPPCTDLLIKYTIPNLYISISDPNPKVAGKGIEKLKSNGCKVEVGLLEKKSIELNKRFFCFHQKKRPYIILKWAKTLDGYMDCNKKDCQNRKKYWITNDLLRIKTHQWRAEESAIFVGANTLLHDNPQLNVRNCAGKNPTRITLITRYINQHLHFFDNTQNSIVFNYEREEKVGLTHFCRLSKEDNPQEAMMQKLYEMNIQSVLIEGGLHILQRFLDLKLWDEARVLIGNKCFKTGLPAPTISHDPYKIETVKEDKVLYYKQVL